MASLSRKLQMAMPRFGLEKTRYKYYFSLLRLLSMIACVIVFVYLMVDIYEKFAIKLTNIGIRTWPHNHDSKDMPCITACPWEAFKHRGLFYNRKLLDEGTFDKEDIFLNQEEYPIFNRSLFSIEEIRSIHFGRCFMVCSTKPFKRNEDFSLMLQYNRSLKGLSGIKFFFSYWKQKICLLRS